MSYLEIALKAGTTILVEDERSPEALSQALADQGEISVSRVEIFDPSQTFEIVLTGDDVAAIGPAPDL